ncbi:MAG: hypothetical protein C4346_09330, partial [Chloroflexota bacterium]
MLDRSAGGSSTSAIWWPGWRSGFRTLNFGMTALPRDQIKLLLSLLEAQPDALLMQGPHVPPEAAICESQLVQLVRDGSDPQAELP